MTDVEYDTQRRDLAAAVWGIDGRAQDKTEFLFSSAYLGRNFFGGLRTSVINF